MKTKTLMGAFSLVLGLAPGICQAQIDLDHPLRVSTTDQVYRSVSDPNTAYAFPKALFRLNEPLIVREGERLKATFEVGVDPSELSALQSALEKSGLNGMQIRYIRPLTINVIAGSGTNLPASFHPEVKPLGDGSVLGGSTQYCIELDYAKPLLGRSKGMQVLETVFGVQGMDHVATLEYEFNAVAMGQPFRGKTAVPIFAGRRLEAALQPSGASSFP